MRGFGDPHRGKIVCRWVKRFHKDLGVLCLQELKAKKDNVDFKLRTLFKGSTFKVNYSNEGKAGAAVVVFSQHKVIAQGSKGDGTFALCTIESKSGPISVGSVCAPNERAAVLLCGSGCSTSLTPEIGSSWRIGTWLSCTTTLWAHPRISMGLRSGVERDSEIILTWWICT